MEAMREAWTDDRLDDLANRMDRGFDRVDKDIRELRAETKSEFALVRGEMCERFDKLEGRFESRFVQVEDRFDKIEGRFESQFEKVEGQFEKVEGQFERVDARFDKVESRFDKIDARFDRMDARFESMQRLMATGAIAMSAAFLAGFAAIGGIIAAGL